MLFAFRCFTDCRYIIPIISSGISVLVDDENFPNKTSLAEEYERLAEMLRQSIENNPKRKKQNNKHIFAKVIEVRDLKK